MPVLDYATQVEGLADRLADQICAGTTSKRLVAVLPFTDARGTVYELGRYTADELVTVFGVDQRFDVIERTRLDQVMKEIALSSSELIDDETARSIGNLLGADALVIGTFTDIGAAIDLNTRIVETESGRIIGADSVVLEREPLVVKLWRPAGRVPPPEQAATAELAAPKQHVVQREVPSVTLQREWSTWMQERGLRRQIKRFRRQRHFPLAIEGRNNRGITEYRVAFAPYPRRRFRHYVVHGLTDRELQKKDRVMTRRKLRKIHAQIFVDSTGAQRHQVIWTE